MQLKMPSVEMEAQFIQFVDDFECNDPENADYYQGAKINYRSYVRSILDEEQGINLQPGYVPCSHRWLIDANNNVVGAIRIRHHINNPFLAEEAGHIGYDVAPSHRNQGAGTAMLKYALAEAKVLGLDKVLLVADEDNVGSRKVIENNGGQLECTVMSKHYGVPIARYWFSL